jgi:hypothetical protein
MARFPKKCEYFLHLPGRRRWSLLLPECHAAQYYRSVRHLVMTEPPQIAGTGVFYLAR